MGWDKGGCLCGDIFGMGYKWGLCVRKIGICFSFRSSFLGIWGMIWLIVVSLRFCLGLIVRGCEVERFFVVVYFEE